MKTTNFLAIAIIAVASFTGQVVAQENIAVQKVKTKSNSTKEKTTSINVETEGTNVDALSAGSSMVGGGASSAAYARSNIKLGGINEMPSNLRSSIQIVPTTTGCDIVSWSWGASNPSNSSGGGMAVGKQKNTNTETQIESIKLKLKEVFVTSHQITNVNEEETSTNAIANGTHIKEATLASRKGSGAGSGKVNVQDLHFTVKCKGKPVAITIDDNGFTMPENCPDGTYDMVASWSWGVSNSSMSTKTVKTTLTIENGVCVDHVINTKGTGGN